MSSATTGADRPLWAGTGLRIAGYGHHYPEQLVTNPVPDPLDKESVDAAVIGDIDVVSRYVATEVETPAYLGVQAARNALADACVDPREVDLLVFSNWTDRQYIPEWAPLVATDLGAERALAFDMCGACTGFVLGIQTASAMLTANPGWTTALVVAADRFSRRVRPESKGELIVGDAAGAVVIRQEAPSPSSGLVGSLVVSDGTRREATLVRPPSWWIKSQRDLKDLAVTSHQETARYLLGQAGLTIGDVDWVIPHPGTGALHRAVRAALGVDEEKFVTNYERIGNTGSASIPSVLSEMRADGRMRPGQLVLASTVGSGWFYGGVLFHV